MDFMRRRERISVDIPVTVTTVLDSFDARIVDLSEHGARIADASLSIGAKFQIEYAGQTLYAQCVWSEIDRIGAHFPFDLADGPLHDALADARISCATDQDLSTFASSSTNLSANPARRSTATGFGRRHSA